MLKISTQVLIAEPPPHLRIPQVRSGGQFHPGPVYDAILFQEFTMTPHVPVLPALLPSVAIVPIRAPVAGAVSRGEGPCGGGR